LSGFLIFRLITRPNFSYTAFLRHRVMRLYPAFAVALSIYCIYVAAFWNQTYDGLTVVANLLMLQGIWELGIKPIIVPTWSLTYEWLFYLAFPLVLLLPAVRGRVSLWHIALVAFAVLAVVAPIGPHYVRLLMFVGGAALATFDPAAVRSRLRGISDIAVIVVYVLGNLLFVARQDYYRFIPVFVVTASLLFAKSVYGDGLLNRVFSASPLRRLGKVSYSFYLFHGLLVIVVCDHVGPLLQWLPEAPRFAILLGFAFSASVAVAALSYRLFEQPYFDRRSTSRSFDIGSTTSANG
jgi:peptidoglycan/LPS O-acetylase OafA/YrhL